MLHGCIPLVVLLLSPCFKFKLEAQLVSGKAGESSMPLTIYHGPRCCLLWRCSMDRDLVFGAPDPGSDLDNLVSPLTSWLQSIPHCLLVP